MKTFLTATMAVLIFVPAGFTPAASPQKSVCLKVNGEKVEIHNLGGAPVVIDRDGIPDFASTSMLESVSTAKGSKSYNLLLTGVKRNDKKAISSFDIKIDEKAYTYPKDSCGK